MYVEVRGQPRRLVLIFFYVESFPLLPWDRVSSCSSSFPKTVPISTLKVPYPSLLGKSVLLDLSSGPVEPATVPTDSHCLVVSTSLLPGSGCANSIPIIIWDYMLLHQWTKQQVIDGSLQNTKRNSTSHPYEFASLSSSQPLKASTGAHSSLLGKLRLMLGASWGGLGFSCGESGAPHLPGAPHGVHVEL